MHPYGRQHIASAMEWYQFGWPSKQGRRPGLAATRLYLLSSRFQPCCEFQK